MSKSSNKSQMLKLSLIATLLVFAPLLSSSLRGTYLYFIFNLLIIALGAEAGLLSSNSKPVAEDRNALVVVTPTLTNTEVVSLPKEGPFSTKPAKVVEKCSSEKIVSTVVIKKCPSTPSLFFIGGGENEAEEMQMVDDQNDHCYDEEEELELDHDHEVVPSGEQDQLFNKAETFIGNFYKQLKMQREDSWKRIHGLYHKAF